MPGDLPVGLPAVAGEPGERAGGGEALEVAPVECARRASSSTLFDRACARACSDERGRRLPESPFTMTQAEAHGRRCRLPRLPACSPIRSPAHPTGRTSTPWRRASCTSLRGRIEAHRLAVQQRAGKAAGSWHLSQAET